MSVNVTISRAQNASYIIILNENRIIMCEQHNRQAQPQRMRMRDFIKMYIIYSVEWMPFQLHTHYTHTLVDWQIGEALNYSAIA